MPKFYVGQKIVAIRSHCQGFFKEGQIFIVTGVFAPICKCPEYLITIDVPFPEGVIYPRLDCDRCGELVPYPKEAGEPLFSEILFEPIVEELSELSIEEAISLVSPIGI